jgi:hypothetical protein
MKRLTILHPLLFAAYVVLFAYGHNFEFAPSAGVVVVLLLAFVGGAALLWAAMTLLTRNPQKAAIAASALVLLFVSYGHIENLITAWSWGFHVFTVQIGYKKMTAAICAVTLMCLAKWLAGASRDTTRGATTALNRVGAALVLLSAVHVLTVVSVAGNGSRVELEAQTAADSSPRLEGIRTGAEPLPDIYYIILDTYGRTDVLKDIYGYDNSAFVGWLRQKGFYVAADSHSNYSQTMLSLASSLNLTYLDRAELKAATTTASDPRWHVDLNSTAIQLLNAAKENQRLPLAHLIQRNLVAETLKARGYRFVALTSGYGGVQFPKADVVLRAAVLTDFEESLLSTTPIPDVADKLYDPWERHRQRVRYVFDHVSDAFGGASPLFVFAHILSPHSPYVFKADGSSADRSGLKPGAFYDEEARDRTRVVAGYRGQTEYVTRRIKSVLEAILADSTRRRIIVLQGDHGPNVEMNFGDPAGTAAVTERMSILNAYYVPPSMRTQLYPSITPVNTFRIILGQLFGRPANLLPDTSYFSPADQPYEFKDVTSVLTGNPVRTDSSGTAQPIR